MKMFSNIGLFSIMSCLQTNAEYTFGRESETYLEFQQVAAGGWTILQKYNRKDTPLDELRDALQPAWEWLEIFPDLRKELDTIFLDNPPRDEW